MMSTLAGENATQCQQSTVGLVIRALLPSSVLNPATSHRQLPSNDARMAERVLNGTELKDAHAARLSSKFTMSTFAEVENNVELRTAQTPRAALLPWCWLLFTTQACLHS